MHGVDEAEIIKADILTYDFETTKYDLVFSMGLVEHFNEPFPILLKHAEILKPGGWLLITLPNFRYFHYISRFIADYDCLKKHNTLLMSVRRLKRYVEKLDIEVVYCDYYGDFDFWIESTKTDWLNRLSKKSILKIADITKKLFRYKPLRGTKSAFFSPYIVVKGKKRYTHA
jgi:SAM-dependent methyltransferase